jgi:hypothetical protein
MKAQTETIEILPPLETHPGGQFWVNSLIGSAESGLCSWSEVKPYMHRLRVADVRKMDKRKWQAGDIMSGEVNHADDYGTYLLID